MTKNRLRQIREREGYKQKEIALVLSMSDQGYNHFERDYSIIPLSKLIILSNYYSVSMDWLINLSDNKDIKYNHKTINNSELGKRIRFARKELGLTQEKLASIFNTTHSVISDYENGKSIIQTQYLYQLCKLSNRSMDWFVSDEKDFTGE